VQQAGALPRMLCVRMLCVHVTNERAVMPGHLGLNVLARRDQFPSKWTSCPPAVLRPR